MKTILTLILLSTINIATFAQETEFTTDKVRIKTNPLSPIIALDKNINISAEFLQKGIKTNFSFQGSIGYIFDWSNISSASNVSNCTTSGVVLTGEFRTYNKGFFVGPYLQYKTMESNFNELNPAGLTIASNVSLIKNQYSAGFIGGYYLPLSKKVGTEIQLGLGFSEKRIRKNGANITDTGKYIDNGTLSMSDNSGRMPQGILTYKITYNF
jgi:Protein of unknown function (DUF3575)